MKGGFLPPYFQVFEMATATIRKPMIAPNSAPVQGLEVIPQVLPAHLLK
jgi:hypothetical protein